MVGVDDGVSVDPVEVPVPFGTWATPMAAAVQALARSTRSTDAPSSTPTISLPSL